MRYVVVLLALFAPPVRAEPTGGSVTGKVIVNEKGKALASVTYTYVYLEPLSPKRSIDVGRAAVIRQEDKHFVPRVVMIPKGGSVVFTNADKEEHNVFGPDPYFDIGRYNRDLKGKSHEFTVEGEHKIYCDIHPQMWARVKVVRSNWFAETAADGTFKLENVPPGTYKLIAWRPSAKPDEPSKRVTVADGKVTKVSDLHLTKGTPTEHVRKDGTKYPAYSGGGDETEE